MNRALLTLFGRSPSIRGGVDRLTLSHWRRGCSHAASSLPQWLKILAKQTVSFAEEVPFDSTQGDGSLFEAIRVYYESDLCPSVRHDMAMVSSLAAIKDSRWLQLEVCREFQRNKCSRSDTECKFAHPPSHVEVQNGRVIACYDSIKGRCNREKPPCKYFHPPQHLKDQLLINGRNHLALKNALLQQIPLQPLLTGQLPTAVVSGLLYSQLAQQQQQQQQLQQQQQCAAAFNLMSANALKATTSPYLPAMAAASTFSPYLGHTPMMTGLLPADALASPLSLVPSPLMTAAQKLQRTDRLEVCREFQRGNCKRSETECRFAHPPEHVTVDSGEGTVTVCMDFVKGRCTRDQCRYFHPPAHLQAQLKAAQTRAGAAAVTFPGIVPYAKRAAVDKSGLPVYQPTGAAYQQALAMQVQQPFVPVTLPVMHAAPDTTASAASNSSSVAYCDDKGQLLDTLPLCRDFKSGLCKRPQCRYVHLLEDYVEVLDGKVTVCRDAVKGKCSRPLCKYYHIPLPTPFMNSVL
ncbi:muscleblind-like protein 1 [Nephila pilipes]|uniref:Muscleblind-like protein 1 n=1 Tax=Nephila pilipes TaxID=299642 RepID=A0A8X6U7D3_NEPPI|nr:muscleblind-like protein 1 [Nephila pilipes]